MKVGDRVVLNSGGPIMTVSRLPSLGNMAAVCTWQDDNGSVKRDTFPVECLTNMSSWKKRPGNRKPYCCFIDSNGNSCDKDATWNAWLQTDPPDIVTQACDDHLGHLCGDGWNEVWPVEE